MRLLRTLRAARGVILALLVFALGLLPPLRTTCACAAKSEAAQTCCAKAKSGTGCCCSTGGCCSVRKTQASCCSKSDKGCECAADPLPRNPVRIPDQKSTSPEVAAAASQPLAWQLPAVIPVLAAGCELPVFGPPDSGPSLQIAFCIWRN